MTIANAIYKRGDEEMKVGIKLGLNESILLVHPDGKLHRIFPKIDGTFGDKVVGK